MPGLLLKADSRWGAQEIFFYFSADLVVVLVRQFQSFEIYRLLG